MKLSQLLLATREQNGVEIIFWKSRHYGDPARARVRAPRQRALRRCALRSLSSADGRRLRESSSQARRRESPRRTRIGKRTGGLYTAGIAGTPLLVLIGRQDGRFLQTEPILSGPLEQMNISGIEVCHRQPRAFVGHMNNNDSAHRLEHLARQINRGPCARRPEVELARSALTSATSSLTELALTEGCTPRRYTIRDDQADRRVG